MSGSRQQEQHRELEFYWFSVLLMAVMPSLMLFYCVAGRPPAMVFVVYLLALAFGPLSLILALGAFWKGGMTVIQGIPGVLLFALNVAILALYGFPLLFFFRGL